jgi:hypothetical protein
VGAPLGRESGRRLERIAFIADSMLGDKSSNELWKWSMLVAILFGSRLIQNYGRETASYYRQRPDVLVRWTRTECVGLVS